MIERILKHMNIYREMKNAAIPMNLIGKKGEDSCMNAARLVNQQELSSLMEGLNEETISSLMDDPELLSYLGKMNKKEDEDIMLDTSYYEKADEIIARHTREERSLIPIIQDIQEKSGATINIEEVGNKGIVDVSATNKESIDKALARIRAIVAKPEVGEVYDGIVKSIMPFGAFIEILPGKDGLLHVSEIDYKRIEKVEDVLKEGDHIQVKLLEVDPKTGKLRLSHKALLPKPEGYQERSERPRGDRNDRGERRERPESHDRGERRERPERRESRPERTEDNQETGSEE